MSKQAKKALVPQIRFPEFNDSPEWNENDLIKLSECSLSNGVFNDPKKVGSGYKLVNVLDMYIDTVIDEDNLSLVELSRDEFLKNKVENGDIFFTRSSLVKSGIAYSNIYLGNSNDITFDGHLIRFRPNKRILIPIFVNYLLRTNRIRSQLVARGKTATMTTIGQTDVESVKVSIPHINEQKKIADCLCSLDELIAAQAQQLDTLKAHKKGLMQQLFPAEGESVPKLRFPEFRDAPGWEEKQLGNCLLTHPEYGVNAPAVPYSESLPTYLRITDISEDGVFNADQKVSVAINITDENYLIDGDIVLARTGASVGKSYRYKIADGQLVFAGFLIRIRPDASKASSVFIHYALTSDFYWKWIHVTSARSGQPGINGNEYASFPVLLPKMEEQQKIADCLVAVDELISAQTQKLGALKAHKKGLMQQLFPLFNGKE